jgi:hypothetical protein
MLGLAGVIWQWRQAESQKRVAQGRAYISEINAAEQALKANKRGRALELLRRHRPAPPTEADLRGFEWNLLWEQAQDQAEAQVGTLSSRIRSLDASRNGRWLAAGSEHGADNLWNLATQGTERPLAHLCCAYRAAKGNGLKYSCASRGLVVPRSAAHRQHSLKIRQIGRRLRAHDLTGQLHYCLKEVATLHLQ